MGAIILAAGRGERLNGYAAPFMKPTLLVNGVPVIVHQLLNALKWTSDITIVVAPENARAIIALVQSAYVPQFPERLQFVIQPEPTGAVDALKRGILTQLNRDLLVLMGDNIVPSVDMKSMCDEMEQGGHELLVSVREMALSDAWRHLTYRTAGIWWEKEYPAACDMSESVDAVLAWVGPFFVRAADEFYAALGNGTSIGKTFNAFIDVSCFQTNCIDIGVPEALT